MTDRKIKGGSKMTRQNITVIIVIMIILGSVVFFSRDQLWPQASACVTTGSPTPSSIPTPYAPIPVQLWGNTVDGVYLPPYLPNGHLLNFLGSRPDRTLLVEEFIQCGPSWVSTYDPSTGSIQQLCSTPNPEGIVDGKYLAWVTYPGANGMSPQNVGYLDMQTCKVTKLFSGRQYENIVGPVVSNGYFFWSRGTIHMTNMATGKTRDLSLGIAT